MKRMQELLEEYGESHRNETNKLIHWICVPAIFFSITGLLYCIKLPLYINEFRINLAVIALVVVWVYYFRLSPALSVGMLFFGAACIALCHFIEVHGFAPLWVYSVLMFALAWVGQFLGHKIEGKKPSFLKDVQFLLIGPAWLMSFVYRKMGLRF